MYKSVEQITKPSKIELMKTDNKDYLEKILPHKKPMILIDDVIGHSVEEGWLKSTVTITKDSKFYDSTLCGVSSVVGIEYMAQTIGCYAFYKANIGKPLVGFLLGTRLYNNKTDVFKENETLEILVKEIFSGNDIVSFECFIYNQKEEIASATINVYQCEKEEDMLNV